MASKERTCYLCGKKPAKDLGSKSRYAHAIKEPVFCTMNCAASWGLISVEEMALTNVHWCDTKGKWEHLAEEQCSDCNPELKNRY